ncbi:MAG: sterol desaturase family protein [Gammaproteobacteria bacterium]|nr:sterol desaturase family protein [Gammaproteobacteria bacterium]
MQSLKNLTPWFLYPLIMTLGFTLFSVFQFLGTSLLISTYVPVLLTATIISLLEFKFPHRMEWRPGINEIKTDVLFMAVVQLAFPPLVGFLFAYALIEPARALNLPLIHLWPHDWPIWLQALFMILMVDFLRYWLHRAAHENKYLWRLHSVHHSVEHLYWLNTGRFHPLEKTLQMSLDSLPFLLMGVDAKVLALYYLAYATNGFFQHSNIRLRFGWLNYIIGSAELHRWHHSREPKESNANYGNNVIIWDLLFGTWYLPKNRDIKNLGLQDKAYPKSFLDLMRAPFTR